MTYYTISQATRALNLIGVNVNYDQVRWAVLSGSVKPARQYGRVRLFAETQLEQLKTHFAKKGGGQ